jgi:hypothetical protein
MRRWIDAEKRGVSPAAPMEGVNYLQPHFTMPEQATW